MTAAVLDAPHHLTLHQSFDPAEVAPWRVSCLCGFVSPAHALPQLARVEGDTHTMLVLVAAIRAGDIGENPREVEFEPLTAPAIPKPINVPEPSQPRREPVPA